MKRILQKVFVALLVTVLATVVWFKHHGRRVFDQPETVVRQIDATVDTLPPSYAMGDEFSLYRAGKNAPAILAALREVAGKERDAMAFLVRYMPRRDLQSLTTSFLVSDVRLAAEARAKVAWGKDIPQDIFLNDVLPYVSVNERRDAWRPLFYKRYIDIALKDKTIHATVLALNKKVFEDLNVRYNIHKREKPDQSPFESRAIGYASCTGLSIILVDALRSVAIPARLVATPQWVDKSGNHTWVEVWDHGRWHYIGAGEKSDYDHTWFTKIAARATPSDPRHGIYAVSYKRTGVLFPTIWNPFVNYVYAKNVTTRYARGLRTAEQK